MSPSRFLILAVCGVTILMGAMVSRPVHAGDELFSEVAMDTVFETTAESSAEVPNTTSRRGVTQPSGEGLRGALLSRDQLRDRLRGMGIDVTQDSRRDGVLVATFANTERTLQIRFATDANDGKIVADITIATSGEIAKWKAADFVSLLSQCRDTNCRPVMESSDGSLLLRSTLSGMTASTETLKNTVRELLATANALRPAKSGGVGGTVIAKTNRNSKSAKLVAKPAVTKQQPALVSKPFSTRRALIAENLKGKWLASINADTAIAIAFGPGNSFQMVHVVAGKQSSSRGVYASKGNGIEFRENGQQKASLRFDVN
ncbi:MAG: hypothetical protein AAFP90_12820, partial [Planctomycetota bacterium]